MSATVKKIIPEIIRLETIIASTKSKISTGELFFTPSDNSNSSVSNTGQISTVGIPILPKISNYILVQNKTPLGNNTIEKKTAYFEQIYLQRGDGFYKIFSPIYSTFEDYAKEEPTSYLLVSSSYMNSENLPIGIQNHKFLGTKLAGKNGEGINQPAIPAVTPDGGPVVIILTTNLEEEVRYKVE